MRQRPATIHALTITLTLLLLGVPAIGLAQTVASVQLTQTSITGGTSALVTGTVSLSSATATGLRVKLSDNADAVTVPGSVTVRPQAQVSLPFTVTIGPVEVPSMVTITAESEDGGPKTAQLLVLPPVLNAVGLLPTSLTGGTGVLGGTSVPVTGKVGLNGRAPTGGFAVQLSSDNPSVAAPGVASITVPAGALASDAFPVTTFPFAGCAPIAVTISASSGAVTKTTVLTVSPALPSAVGVLPASIKGGSTGMTVRVGLTGPAPTGGIDVQLTSSNPAVATVQQQPIHIPAGGLASAEFPVTTFPVATSTTVIITTSVGVCRAGVQSTQLTVNP